MAAIDVTIPNRPTVEITHPNVVIGNCADGSATNSDGSFTIAVPSGVDVPLPNINFTDSDGTTTSVPSVQDIVATACGATGGTLTIGVYSDAGHTTPITSADFGDTIYIKSTVTGITPTEYRFFVFETASNGVATVQVGDSISYDITSFNDLVIYAEAKDASVAAAAFTSFEVTINADADATAFINAHNTASGQTMAAAQQQVIQGLFQRLKGIGTTNSSDLWTKLSSSNSEIYPFAPVDDSTVSIPAYALDLVDPSTPATWNGFILSDYAVTGVSGGTSKYLAMKRAPSDYGQNDVGVDAYVRAAGGFPGLVGVGASASGANSNAVLVQPSSTGGFYKVNTTVFPSYSATTNKGLQSAQRDNASTNAAYVRGILVASNSSASVTPTINIFYGLANNTGTTSERNYTNEVAMVASRCSFTTTEMQDWNECWEYYQTNIITGGRNV